MFDTVTVPPFISSIVKPSLLLESGVPVASIPTNSFKSVFSTFSPRRAILSAISVSDNSFTLWIANGNIVPLGICHGIEI